MSRVWLLIALLGAAVAVILMVRAKLRAVRGEGRDGPPSWLLGAILFVLPLPVLMAAIIAMARGLLVPLLGNALGAALFAAGAWLLWRGLGAEMAAARPRERVAWPLKTLGTGLIGMATGITAWLGVGHHPGIALAFGLVAWLGGWLFYGGDRRPLERVRGATGRDRSASFRSALAQAEQAITAIEQTSRQIAPEDLRARLGQITRLAREVLTLLEDDPRELPRARRFLSVYLEGVQRVVEGYATAHRRAALGPVDERFRRVLEQIEAVFEEQRDRLMRREVMDLDVEIEVLMNQLKGA
jgi:5-bromo-4-chloroindolyl phosphate hydrolysis protein